MFYCSPTDLTACIVGRVTEWLARWICTVLDVWIRSITARTTD